MRSRLTALVLAVAALCALATAPAEAHVSSKKAIWGPVDQFPLYHKLGVTIYETAVDWANVAATRPASARDPHDAAYQWPADLTTAIRQARRYKMRVAVMLTNTPNWANGNRGPNYAPTDSGDFA